MSLARVFHCLTVSIVLFLCAAVASADIMLPNVYQGGVDITEYLASEKLDGVRARWDGEKLISRGGNVFAAPPWFTKDFPSQMMDGELWTGKAGFEEVVSIVRRDEPHPGWAKVKYVVFDLPGHGGPFKDRDGALGRIVSRSGSPYLKKIRQFKVRNPEHLAYRLEQITASGGEGLMLHRKDAFYKAGRSSDLLKVKKFFDAEAVVVAHNHGKGKFKGMLGSLTVETSDGVRFKVGTGFTDEERKNPPPVGSTITYSYTGLTNTGKPKSPSFVRVRY